MPAQAPTPAPAETTASNATRPNEKIAQLHALLKRVERDFSPAAFATSYGAEDMVLTDLIARHFPGITIFTLNTGRLPQETLTLRNQVSTRYSIDIAAFEPDALAVQQYVVANGLNAFYESVELRKACCHVRKVLPLQRALAGKRAWLTGLRREQAPSRQTLALEEFDATHGLTKFNPLIDWTNDDIWTYIHANGVPYNALHDRGYPSIGCEPCTRAVKPGEDIRAGRWWWENKDGQKECGLHVDAAAASAIPQYASIQINVVEKANA